MAGNQDQNDYQAASAGDAIVAGVPSVVAARAHRSGIVKLAMLTFHRHSTRDSESFVEDIVVSPGNAVVRYTIPMPDAAACSEWTSRSLLFTVRYCLTSSLVGRVRLN